MLLIDLGNFTPGLSLAGGIVIGVAAAVLVLFNGRIAGISGILGGLLSLPRRDMTWRVAFLIGLIGAPILAALFGICLLYTSPSPRDQRGSRMPSSA